MQAEAPLPRRSGVAWVVVAAATLALYGVLAVWASVTPAFRAPDEPQQISTVLSLGYDHAYPAPGHAEWYPAIVFAYGRMGQDGTPRHMPVARGDAGRYETLEELGNGAKPKFTRNQMTQHPPGYYLSLAVPARLLDVTEDSPRGGVLALRLLSAAWLLPLPALVFLIGRSFGLPDPVASAGAFLPLAIPQFTYLGGVVTSDAALATVTALLCWLLTRVAAGDSGRRLGVAVGLAWSVALLVKGLALALAPAVLLAFPLCARRSGWRAALPQALLAGVASLPGLAWWVRNAVVYGAVQPQGYPASELESLPNGGLSLGTWLGRFLESMARTFWLDYGYIELDPERWAYLGATALLLTAVVVALVRERRHRGAMAAGNLMWVLVLLLVLSGGFQSWQQTASVRGGQGRYLYGGVAVILATALVAVRPWLVGRAWLPALLPLAAFAVALGGLERGVWHFYAGPTLRARVVALSSWSPIQLRYLALFLVVGGVLAALSAGLVWRSGRDRAGVPAPA
jgi:hypothetical protein